MHLSSYLVGIDRQKMVIIIMFAPPFSTRTMLAGNNIADSGEEECSMAGNHAKYSRPANLRSQQYPLGVALSADNGN